MVTAAVEELHRLDRPFETHDLWYPPFEPARCVQGEHRLTGIRDAVRVVCDDEALYLDAFHEDATVVHQ